MLFDNIDFNLIVKFSISGTKKSWFDIVIRIFIFTVTSFKGVNGFDIDGFELIKICRHSKSGILIKFGKLIFTQPFLLLTQY